MAVKGKEERKLKTEQRQPLPTTVFITALHCMQRGLSYRKGVCLSVRHTREL